MWQDLGRVVSLGSMHSPWTCFERCGKQKLRQGSDVREAKLNSRLDTLSMGAFHTMTCGNARSDESNSNIIASPEGGRTVAAVKRVNVHREGNAILLGQQSQGFSEFEIIRASTSARENTSASMRMCIVSYLRSCFSRSAFACALGLFRSNVPVYSIPLWLMIRTYSPSELESDGLPRLEKASVPSALMLETIRPSVST